MDPSRRSAARDRLLAGPREDRSPTLVRPGGWADQPLYLRDAECTVEIHEDDKTELRFTLSSAGRLRITARDGQARRVTTPCRVMTGRRIRQALFRCHPDEGADTTSSTNVGAGVNEVYPALAPGDYHVELGGERFVRRGFDVTIQAGQTTELDVVLREAVAPSPR